MAKIVKYHAVFTLNREKKKMQSFTKLTVFIFTVGVLFSQIDYNSEIQPIFNAKCTSCHGNSAGLNLESYSGVMAGGNNGAVVVPGNHSGSELWVRVNSGQMPPGNNDLTSSEVELVAQWINEGALESASVSGCTDPEAYSCSDDDVYTNYIFDVGGIMYDNSCNWDWNTNTNEADYVGGCEDSPCEGYYNPSAASDDGSCRYYQAPYGEVVNFSQIDATTIYLEWSGFTPPANAEVESYHIQRCTEGCSWLPGFTPADASTDMEVYDEYEYVPGVSIKYAIAVKYSNNPYWGWAIGASYFTPEEFCNVGDLNQDGGWNVLDIVTLANCILGNSCEGCEGDLNSDGVYNVLDIVTLANCILGQNCGGRVDDAEKASLHLENNTLKLKADGYIGGVQMTLSHHRDFSINLTESALFANYVSEDYETRLIIVSPESDELFTYQGAFEITDLMVANSQSEVNTNLPMITTFELGEAYPNPFNPQTMITLNLNQDGFVHTAVYNVQGMLVETLTKGNQTAGTYNFTWNCTEVPSGMYILKTEVDGLSQTRKLMLLK
ncbi:MAG: c-type cytochrome domain-containing protein [Candidatus Marinimicrobia bacterium]|nr:c-type cytochrome domain-containing protein [Candidatus Neomarinimicrobiota bacterium]